MGFASFWYKFSKADPADALGFICYNRGTVREKNLLYRLVLALWVGSLSYLSTPANARALSLRLAPVAGLMQQPTSQYYHAVYGVSSDISFADDTLFLRALYIERPEFSDSGFEEKDFGGFTFFGTSVLGQKKPWSFNALIGAGRMAGYIRADEKKHPELNAPDRTYSLNGVAMGAEAAIRLSYLESAFIMQHFTGLISEDEVRDYISWPFNFFLVRVGMSL